MSSLLKSVDAQTLSRLSGLKLRARAVVEGVLSGLHKSPHQGQSVEFAEHKEYAPGDELRHLDWKALGKFDRYYVKRFEHETNLRAVMAIDGSPSMAYQSKALSKLEVARILAAALSYILVRQQDAVGITVFSGQTTVDVAPRANAAHLNVVLDALEGINTRGDTQLKYAADHLAEKLPRRSLICVFSDFLDDDAQGLRRILALKARRHDLALFHILDPAELEFPFEDPTRFLSMEDDRQLEVNPAEIRDSYLQEFNQFLTETRQACMSADVDYERVRTDEGLDQVLLRFLSKRAGR